MDYKVLDEIKLEVTKTTVVEPEVTEYKLDFLTQQRLDILKQRNDFVEERTTELAEVDVLIAKCAELGVKSEIEIEEAKVTVLEADIIKK